jgi:multidrug efflux pump subunit AcrB
VSLLVSLTLTPTLSARFLKITKPGERKGIAWRIASLFDST